MKNASYIITDTFHGCVMSIKFNRQFIALVRDSNRQKMSSLLDQFGLSGRMCESVEDLTNRMDQSSEYDKINKYIELEKELSMKYLKSAVGGGQKCR